MKILHLSTSDLDGGAAKAAYRLHQGLLQAKVDSRMLVRAKSSNNPSVVGYKPLIAQFGSKLDSLPLRKYPERDRAMFSPQWFPDAVVSKVKEINPDIIHLHWTCNGYLQIESLAKFNKPIIWTLHDMWAFTGGCHYTQGCDRYTKGCGSCPQLGSTKPYDLSAQILQRKAKAWRDLNLTIVTPSHWLAKCVSDSSVLRDFRVEVIPNGLDTQRYKPIDQQIARDALNLPQDKLLVLFGAGSTSGDPRKGFQHLLSALQRLEQEKWDAQLELVIFGESRTENELPIAFKAHYLGRLSDDVSLALAYSSADVFVAPSVQDNLPNTVVEALACGTPCVAFEIGGMGDMIKHYHNGYLAKPFDIEDLSRGITWTLEDNLSKSELSKNARAYALNQFELFNQASQFVRIYQQILVRNSLATPKKNA